MPRKLKLLLIALVSLSACDAGMRADSEEFVAAAIVAACEQLVIDYAIARDLPDPVAYAATFADDGELILPSGRFRGREAIQARAAASAKTSISSHMMSTSQIKVQSATRATGTSYATIFIEARPAELGTAVATSGPAAVGVYHDEFALTSRGWKIVRREFKPKFDWQKD